MDVKTAGFFCMQTTNRVTSIFVVLALMSLSPGFGDAALPHGHTARRGNSGVFACLSRDSGLRVSRAPAIRLPIQLWFRPAPLTTELFQYELLPNRISTSGIPLPLWTLRLADRAPPLV